MPSTISTKNHLSIFSFRYISNLVNINSKTVLNDGRRMSDSAKKNCAVGY